MVRAIGMIKVGLCWFRVDRFIRFICVGFEFSGCWGVPVYSMLFLLGRGDFSCVASEVWGLPVVVSSPISGSSSVAASLIPSALFCFLALHSFVVLLCIASHLRCVGGYWLLKKSPRRDLCLPEG